MQPVAVEKSASAADTFSQFVTCRSCLSSAVIKRTQRTPHVDVCSNTFNSSRIGSAGRALQVAAVHVHGAQTRRIKVFFPSRNCALFYNFFLK